MLKNIKNDLVYTLDILNYIGKIKRYSKNYNSPESLFEANDQLNFNACLNLLANIGERANKLSDELKSKYSHLAWSKIISYRNRIVHDYKSINIVTTFEIIKKKLLDLEINFIEIIESELRAQNFDVEEFKVARESSFYRFTDFSKINY